MLDCISTDDTTLDATRYDLETGKVKAYDILILINLSSLPHLQCLTIRAGVWFDQSPAYCSREDYSFSFLPAAIEIIKTASSLHHLTIEISLGLSGLEDPSIDRVDFSPLTALEEISTSLHHIDLYIFYHHKRDTITYFEIMSVLGDHLGKVIARGALVIHLNEMAPTFLVSSDL